MAQPQRKPRLVPARLVDRGVAPLPADDTAPPAADSGQIKTHITRQVVVVEVAGALRDVGQSLDTAIQCGLAEVPRGVACDLSAVSDGALPEAVDLLATAGRHVREWPAIPVAVACPDPRVREALSLHPLGGQLIVTHSILSALTEVLATPALAVEWLRLAPHPTAPRASRDFVSRTLMDWRLGGVIATASLVISELVTNSTMYVGSDIILSIAWNQGALRLTVRDNSPRPPRQRHTALALHGRGLTIVAGLSRAFGVLPTADGGKVVWAVMDAPRRAASSRSSRPVSDTKEYAMSTVLDSLPRPVRRALPSPAGAAKRPALEPRASHAALVLIPRAARTLALARAGTAQRSELHPYNDPSNYLG
jgi:hypothetical protein